MRKALLVAWAAAALLLSACSDADPSAPAGQVPVARVEVEPAAITLAVGETRQLTARAYGADGGELPNRPIAWSSVNDTIATVAPDGTVTARRAGMVTLRAASGGKQGSAAVQVVEAGPVPAASVVIEPAGPLALVAGTDTQLAAVVRAANDSLLIGREIAWSSSNAAVATVSAGGLLSAAAPGTASIIAAVDGAADTVAVVVQAAQQPVARVELLTDGLVSLLIGETKQLGLRLFAADDTELFGRPIAWTSSAHHIAAVNTAGVVTAHEFGTADVTATVEGVSVHIAINVTSPVANVAVTAPVNGIAVGDVVQLTSSVRSASGQLLQRPVTWTSSNPAVAHVDATGRVTGVAGGSALIVATSDNQQGWIEITVGAWVSRPLQAIDETALPVVLWTGEDANGVVTTVTATSGTLRLALISAAGGRFDQTFAVMIVSGNNVPQYGMYGFGGTYTYHAGTGTLSLHGYSGETLTAELLPGGGIRVTGRLEAGRAPRGFLYGPVQ